MTTLASTVLPVVFARGTSPEPIKFLSPEGQPFWPPASVFVSKAAHAQLMSSAKAAAAEQPDLAGLWQSEDALLQNLYSHLLANVITHLLTGGWTASDRDWMAKRCRAWGSPNLEAAGRRLDAGVDFTVDYMFSSKHQVAATLCKDGRISLN